MKNEWNWMLNKKETENQKECHKMSRGIIELWLDCHNHKMELMRTLTSLIAALASTMVLWRVW